MPPTALLRGASACALILASVASAEAQVSLPQIVVGAAPAPVASAPDRDAKIVDQKEIEKERPAVADTAKLLENTPGVSMYEAGGVSRLPAIHGMADDRLKIIVGGVQPTSACANHMNPPLSYIDPNNVQKIEVFSGVMPVSRGGDSIGGSIIPFDHRDAATAGLRAATWRANSAAGRGTGRAVPAWLAIPSVPAVHRSRPALWESERVACDRRRLSLLSHEQ